MGGATWELRTGVSFPLLHLQVGGGGRGEEITHILGKSRPRGSHSHNYTDTIKRSGVRTGWAKVHFPSPQRMENKDVLFSFLRAVCPPPCHLLGRISQESKWESDWHSPICVLGRSVCGVLPWQLGQPGLECQWQVMNPPVQMWGPLHNQSPQWPCRVFRYLYVTSRKALILGLRETQSSMALTTLSSDIKLSRAQDTKHVFNCQFT